MVVIYKFITIFKLTVIHTALWLMVLVSWLLYTFELGCSMCNIGSWRRSDHEGQGEQG